MTVPLTSVHTWKYISSIHQLLVFFCLFGSSNIASDIEVKTQKPFWSSGEAIKFVWKNVKKWKLKCWKECDC